MPCEILNPIDGEEFNAETEQEWFEIILEQERGGIRLQIPENATAEDRVAEITFAYEYAETKTLALVQKTVKEYEVINGIKWAVNNCGDPSSPLGSYYNWKERETACPRLQRKWRNCFTTAPPGLRTTVSAGVGIPE